MIIYFSAMTMIMHVKKFYGNSRLGLWGMFWLMVMDDDRAIAAGPPRQGMG